MKKQQSANTDYGTIIDASPGLNVVSSDSRQLFSGGDRRQMGDSDSLDCSSTLADFVQLVYNVQGGPKNVRPY